MRHSGIHRSNGQATSFEQRTKRALSSSSSYRRLVLSRRVARKMIFSSVTRTKKRAKGLVRFLPFGKKHPVAARIGWGSLTLLMVASILIETSNIKIAETSYALSPQASELIGRPSDLMAQSLRLNPEKQVYEYNKGYTPGGEVGGQIAGPKFSATIPLDPKQGTSITDPYSETSISFVPKFTMSSPRQDANRLIYPLAGSSAQKVYTMSAIGVKEDIILNEFRTDAVSYEYELKLPSGTEARLESNGELSVYGVTSSLLGNVSTATEKDAQLLEKARQTNEKNNLLFTFPAPFVKESGKKKSNATAWFTYKNGVLGLHASGLKQAQYPLTIDPSVYIETAAKLMRGNNETNIDFDVNDQLIQKSQTTGARIDEWSQSTDINTGIWGQASAAYGGKVYMAGGKSNRVLPRVVGKQVTSDATNGNSFTMSMPSPRPAGDLYVAIMCHAGDIRMDPPAGWTEYADVREHAAYYKIGTDQGSGNESGAYSFNTTNTGESRKFSGVILRIQNFDSTDVVSGTAATGNNASDAVPVYPAVTPDTQGTLMIRSAGFDDDQPPSVGWSPTATHSGIAADSASPDATVTDDCGFTADALDVPALNGVSSGTATLVDPGANESYRIFDTYGSSSIAINGVTATSSNLDTVQWAQVNPVTSALDSPNPGDGSCSGWCASTASTYKLPSTRVGMSMVAYNGYLYAVGGSTDGVAANVQNNVWIAKLGANGEPQLWHPTDTNQANWVYWYQSAQVIPTFSLQQVGLVVNKNRLYMLGGMNSSGGTISTVRFADLKPNGDIAAWSTAGMTTLPVGLWGHSVQIYNDVMYVLGGYNGANTQNIVYYNKLTSTGAMSASWIQSPNTFATARTSLGGNMSVIWGGYIYIAGGCNTINASRYCTNIAEDTQLASINADGSIAEFDTVLALKNQRFAYSFIAWQGGLYRLGGCSVQDASTGACYGSHIGAEYGVINQDGDASTVNNSEPSGTAPCSGGSPTNCDLPPAGDAAGQGGQMSSMVVINNGYIYNIGGCVVSTSSCDSNMSGNVSYAALNAQGQMVSPATCPGTSYGLWCVDSTNQLNGATGLGAAGVATFNNYIYVVGGTNSAAWQSNIWRVQLATDGSLSSAWQSQTLTSLGLSGTADDARGYLYAFTRANPNAASSAPGNLYLLGGCSGTGGIGCSTYYSDTIKCEIRPTGLISNCTTSGQLQIDGDDVNAGNQGLGLMAGTLYANRIYLVGGSCATTGGTAGAPCGSTYAANRKDTIYAKIDNSNNIVDNDSGTATAGDAWTFTTGQMNPVRRRAVAFGYNGYIYSLAGYSGSASLEDLLFAKIDVTTGDMGIWDNSGVVVTPRWDLRAVVNNGYVYAIGGCALGAAPSGCSSMQEEIQTFQLYNNDSGSPVSYTTSANQFATDRLGASSAVLNGYIYVAGGCTGTSECASVTSAVEYAPIDIYGNIGTWTTGNPLTANRAWGQLETAGGALYYIGGQSSAGGSGQTTIYYSSSISAGNPTWATSGSALPAGRTQFSATSWNNRLYVTGGIGTGGTCDATLGTCDTTYVSSQQNSGGSIASWSTTTAFNIDRSGHTTIAYANNLYVIGGYDGEDYLSDVQFAKIASDGTVGAWSYTSSLPEGIRNADGFAVNGYMYLIGGRTPTGDCSPSTLVAPISANTAVDSGNDPTGVGEWYETNAKYTGDRYGAAVAYSAGKAYVLGGACGFPTVSSVNTQVFSSNTTAHNVTMPTVVSAGDLLLALITNDGTATITDPDGAGGWTEITTQTRNGANVRGSVWAKDAVGTEDGTTVNFVTSATEEMSTQVYRVPSSKWGGTVPTHVEANNVSLAADTSAPDPASLNPAGWGTENTLWIAYAAGSSYTSTTNYPTGFGSGIHTISNTGTAGSSASSARLESAVGTVDAGTFTMANSTSGVPFMIAIRPATFNYTGATSASQAVVYSQPQVAKYSRMIDTDTDVFPTKWLLNGVDNSIGARWQLSYRSMHDLDAAVNPNEDCGTSATMAQMTTWGQDTSVGDVTLGTPGTYTPKESGGGNINCARYFYFYVSIDASQTFGYPEDVSRGPTIADLSLFFTSDPSKRLIHGKTFTGGEQQPLDTPF